MANISVIIPAYNRAGLIGETLQSLLNQSVQAKEIIVVDDGSTDGTAEVVERIAKEIEEKRGAWSVEQGALDSGPSTLDSPPAMKPRLRVIRQANAGPGAARNRGLAEAMGEFIHFFDSDDIAALNKQEVQLRALLETGADIAYGQWCKGRFVNLTTEDTTEHRGRCEMEQPKVGPKGERVGTIESKNTEEKAVLRLASQAGAAFSNPSTSELARDSENTSLTRSASGPALARIAPEDRRLKIEAGEANSPATSYSLPVTAPKALALDSGRSTLDSGPQNFVPEGPVLQARGLPEGDLVQALLTNWSIVPHACLFRRSILERAGGFPEDIWVGEDQLLFLRCLLAGAKLVHTPGTMVYYRVGNDPGKLTATGAAQKRHARDWGSFLLSAKKEIEEGRSAQLSSYCTSRAKEIGDVTAEARRRGDFFGGGGSRGLWRTEVVSHGGTANTEEPQGDAQGTCAGASEPDSLASKLADSPFSESLTCSASGPASLPATSYSLPATAPEALTTPSSWFGFRLRAYEAWRDLEKFFPDGEWELKMELLGIWRRSAFSGFGFQVSGFLLRKLAGLKLRALGYREHGSFRCERPSRRAGQKIGPVK